MSRASLRRWLPIAGVAVAALMATVVAASTASATTLFSATFEDNSIASWSKSGGTWSVVSDGSLAARQSSPRDPQLHGAPASTRPMRPPP